MTSEQKSLILGAIDLAKNNGYDIIRGDFGVFKKCCPIRALFLQNPSSKDLIENAADVLHCTESQIWSFIFGFDNARPMDSDKRPGDTQEFYNFGKELHYLFFKNR